MSPPSGVSPRDFEDLAGEQDRRRTRSLARRKRGSQCQPSAADPMSFINRSPKTSGLNQQRLMKTKTASTGTFLPASTSSYQTANPNTGTCNELLPGGTC